MTNHLHYFVISGYFIKISRVIINIIACIFFILLFTPVNTAIAQAMAEKNSYALAGFEGGPGNTYSYLGMIQPLHKSLGDSIVTRLWLDRLTYSYDKNGRKIRAEAYGGEAALGYRKSKEWGWWAAYAGVLYRDTSFSPNDPGNNIRGGKVRAKLQLEGQRNITDRWRTNAIVSFVPGQNSYWARGRLLYRLGDVLSVGPEVIGLGDLDFNIMQFGMTVVGIRILSRLDVNLKAGARITEKRGTTGYGGIELGFPF